MNIIEAVKSGQWCRREGNAFRYKAHGKIFARRYDKGTCDGCVYGLIVLSTEDLLADDWEVCIE